MDVTACQDAVIAMTDAVNAGDLTGLEAIVTGQVVALNAMFANFAHRARHSKYVDGFEQSMRLALKTQSQCRATVETLATMKTPPILFARQANISQGPQQVNNGVEAGTRAREFAPTPTKLLEAANEAERLDAGTAGEAGASDQTLAPVGTVHGAAKRSRQGTR